MGDKFKISDLHSEELQKLAKNVNTYYGDNDKDGKISKKELQKLRSILNGEEAYKAELANESDDIKKVFGYKGSVKADKTEAAKAVTTPEAASETKGAKSKSEQVKDAYYRYRGIDSITREPLKDASGNAIKGLSPKEAYEAVAKDFDGNKEFKDAVKDLRKYSIDTEAKLVVIDAIDRAKSQKSKDVKKEAEAILKQEGNWDKHTKKALNGNSHNWWSNTFDWLSLRNSDMKLIRKAQAAGNKAAEKATKTYEEKDFTDAIGKRSPLFQKDENGKMAIQKLTNTSGEQLVTEKDGKYNVEKLSEFIGTLIGSDNTLSRQAMKADAELEAIRSEFRAQGIDLTKRDTKQLVEFLGYKVEHKNFVKAAYDGTLGGVAAAAGTAVALATQAKDVFKASFKNHNHIELNLQMDFSSLQSILNDAEMQKLIESGAVQTTDIEGGIQVLVDQDVAQSFMHTASRHIPLNVLKSAGVGAAVGVLAGLLEYGPSEEDIFSRDFKCRDYESFIKYIDARKELTDAQKIALKQVALNYLIDDGKGNLIELKTQRPQRDEKGALVLDKEGKPIMEETTTLAWDCEGFKDFLNKKAGYTSNLNRIELFKAVKNAPVKEVPQQVVQEEEPCVDCETKKEPGKVFTVQPKDIKFRSWQDLVNGYDCINSPEYKKVIKGVALNNRMVKVIQAIDVSNVKSEEELKQVYNIKTIAAFAEDAIRFGFAKAAANHPELPVNKTDYMNTLTATAGLKGKAYIPTLYDENGQPCEWTQKANADIDRGTGKGTTATITRKGNTVNGQETYWRKCPGSDWEKIDKSTYDALQK